MGWGDAEEKRKDGGQREGKGGGRGGWAVGLLGSRVSVMVHGGDGC